MLYLNYDNDMGGELSIPFDIIPLDYIYDVDLVYDEFMKGIIGIDVHVFGGWLHCYDKYDALEMFDRIMEHFAPDQVQCNEANT